MIKDFVSLIRELRSYPQLAEWSYQLAEMYTRAERLEAARYGSSKDVLRELSCLLILLWCKKKLTERLPDFSIEDRPNVMKAISGIFVFTRLDALINALDLPAGYLHLPVGHQALTEVIERLNRLTDTKLVFLCRCVDFLTKFEQRTLHLYLIRMHDTDNSKFYQDSTRGSPGSG